MTIIHHSPRALGKNNALLDGIQKQFDDGAKVIEIKSHDPFVLRNSLYKMIRRRKLNWRFAIEGLSLFVTL